VIENEPLYESAHFSVDWPDYDDDAVVLSGRGVPTGLVIGRFFYGPRDVAIDRDERWCVIVGSGLVVYKLRHPWMPYDPGPVHRPANRFHKENWGLPEVRGTDQWWEYGRDRPGLLELDSVAHVGGERFEAGWNPRTEDGPTRWAIMAESRIVRPLNWLPDIP
jgi:hypothetical protein